METASGNMCRCCASEGVFKDLATTYHWMGEEEIYGDMLRECFDIQLSSMENADGGICEVCITQLRNASNFKKQVLLTEEQFKSHLQNVFKPGIVKVEVTRDEGNSTDDNATDDGMSGPEFDDIPIKIEGTTKNEKEDLEIKPKKRSSVKPSTSTAKKSVSSDDEPLKKRKQRDTGKKLTIFIERDKGTKDKKKFVLSKKLSNHTNTVQEILRHTNATPIGRSHVVGYDCCYCKERFLKPALLKDHTLKSHSDVTKAVFMKKSLKEFVVKLDITSLKCKLCGDDLDTINETVEHLKTKHKKGTSLEYIKHIVPFKFDSDKLQCHVCLIDFMRFKTLQLHMYGSHFKNFECPTCGAGFINERQLTHHKKNHETGEFLCKYCPKTYNTHLKRKCHERSHLNANCHKCPYCGEGFPNNKYKWKHIAENHDVPLPIYECKACDKTFQQSTLYYNHLKRDHLLDRPYDCKQCDKKFFTKFTLRRHTISHTGEREFQCKVCCKCFGRMSTLTEHMRIHNNDRRFKCQKCNQAFVQKCSWRGHMRNKHGEDV